MKLRVIFLDIDGMLNSAQEAHYHNRLRKKRPIRNFIYCKIIYKIMVAFPSWLSHRSKWLDFYHRLDLLNWYFALFTDHHDFCPIACSNLQEILDECPEAKIVVSSVWRSQGVWWLKKILNRNGIDGSRIIGRTGHGGKHRGDQIKAWMKDKKVHSYVILDDDSDMGNIKHKLVQTSYLHGLQFKDAQRAIFHLNGTCGWCKGKGRSRWKKRYGTGPYFKPPCPYCHGRGYRRIRKDVY